METVENGRVGQGEDELEGKRNDMLRNAEKQELEDGREKTNRAEKMI
jgi:hypothetical protein